ncbi:hypothetical protein BGZ51_007661 [Haplosporangium sp. Z 767]|nr:hypothetical protein BGZ50_005374 [Haplosporangium sp. Z 11]KAF9191210.1 hypothetical protein BGZ51_007661 [Haplosporangium sp. Z 767]
MLFKSYTNALALCAMAILAFVSTSEAHVGLKRPCARGSPLAGCPAPSNGQSVDYNLNSPIGTHDSKNSPLCKTTAASTVRPVYNAGQSIKTEYSVGASHGGGHCQWALSYDNGKTWVVIQTMLRDCLKGVAGGAPYSVNVKIPKDAPSGKATFMWLWNNAVGNRELYSNCADIEIKGSNGGSLKGVAPLIANYGSNSVLIPEFAEASMDDKAEVFSNRASVTVSASK